MERDLTVYIIQQGENPAMAFDTTDLDAHVFLQPNVWKAGLLKLTITIGLQSSSYIKRC